MPDLARCRIGSGTSSGVRRPPWATLGALLVVGLPTLAQLTVAPGLLEDVQRDRSATGDGQLWRLVTALVVQDGGVPGTGFNLLSLTVIGLVAEAACGTRRWIVIALGAGMGAQLWGWAVQPVGAGNSVAVFGLAASLAVLALRQGPRGRRRLSLAGLLAATVLLGIGDIHGGAAAIGGALGAVLTPHGGAAA